jgi:hypothetical protein
MAANGRNLDGPSFAVTAWNRSREKANARGVGIALMLRRAAGEFSFRAKRLTSQ